MKPATTATTAAQRIAAAEAAMHAAIAASEAAKTELEKVLAADELAAIKESVIDSITNCTDKEMVCASLFTMVKEFFPEKVKSFTIVSKYFDTMKYDIKRTRTTGTTTARTPTTKTKTKATIMAEVLAQPDCTKAMIETALRAVYPEITDSVISQHIAKYAKKTGDFFTAK